jgi:hypothetical protein
MRCIAYQTAIAVSFMPDITVIGIGSFFFFDIFDVSSFDVANPLLDAAARVKLRNARPSIAFARKKTDDS